MSQERRERQKERLGDGTSGQKLQRTVLYAVVVLAVAAVAYYLWHRGQHEHDAFARCLGSRGVKMYGAYWCPHCQDQKEMFAASFKFVPYVECGVLGDPHAQSQACKDENVKHYPTWQFPPTGERVERVFSLEELSERTSCPLP